MNDATYEFSAPQGGDFSSLFFNDDNIASDYFDANRPKRHHSPPPPNIRDYSLQPEKYMRVAEPVISQPLNRASALFSKRSSATRKINTPTPNSGIRIPRRPEPKVEPFKLVQFMPKTEKKNENTIKTFTARPVPKSIYTRPDQFKMQLKTHKIDHVEVPRLNNGEVQQIEMHSYGLGWKKPDSKRCVQKPFSFETRNIEMIKKKEERLKEAERLEGKQKGFHANPLPIFPQPKNVHMTLKAAQAADAVRSQLNQPDRRRYESADGSEHNNLLSFRIRPRNFQEEPVMSKKFNRATVGMKLHTEVRAKEREEFNRGLRERELEKELLRQQMAEEEEKRIKAEMAQLRKTLGHKALPLPNYKQFVLKKSDKPLTSPETPVFCRISRKNDVESMEVD